MGYIVFIITEEVGSHSPRKPIYIHVSIKSKRKLLRDHSSSICTGCKDGPFRNRHEGRVVCICHARMTFSGATPVIVLCFAIYRITCVYR